MAALVTQDATKTHVMHGYFGPMDIGQNNPMIFGQYRPILTAVDFIFLRLYHTEFGIYIKRG